MLDDHTTHTLSDAEVFTMFRVGMRVRDEILRRAAIEGPNVDVHNVLFHVALSNGWTITDVCHEFVEFIEGPFAGRLL